MASPQIEDGYTRIANLLLEALTRIRIPGEAMQIFLAILRKTYGFQKKEDEISLSQFNLATGLSKSHVCDSLRKLKMMNLIAEKGNETTKTYSINKDFSTWKPLPKKGTFPKKGKSLPEKGNKPFPNSGTTKDNIIKKKEICASDSIEVGLSEKLLSLIRQRNPNFKQPDLQKWATHVDRMLRIDRRSPEEIERVITWCQQDSFWCNNILSTEKLRKQYDRLFMQMNSNGKHIPVRHRGVVI